MQMRTAHRERAMGERTFRGDGVDSLCGKSRSLYSPPTPRRASHANSRVTPRGSEVRDLSASSPHPAQSGGRVLGAEARESRRKSLLHGALCCYAWDNPPPPSLSVCELTLIEA